jgi:hypothetical protein
VLVSPADCPHRPALPRLPRRFVDGSPAAYSSLQAAGAGTACSVVLSGLEAGGGDVQLVASVLQLQSLAKAAGRSAGLPPALLAALLGAGLGCRRWRGSGRAPRRAANARRLTKHTHTPRHAGP